MRHLIFTTIILAVTAMPCTAAVTGLFNTGAGVTAGEVDLNYTIVDPEGVAYAITGHNNWVAPDGDAMWISPSNVLEPQTAGFYDYVLTFTINTNPELVTISGLWATDNAGEIFLNDNATGIVRPEERSYENLEAFTLSEYLIRGENTLKFRVECFDGSGSYSGLLVTDLAASVIPAPGAILLGSIGVGFVSWMKRKRCL